MADATMIWIDNEIDPDEAGTQPSLPAIAIPIAEQLSDSLPHPFAVLRPAAYRRLVSFTTVAKEFASPNS